MQGLQTELGGDTVHINDSDRAKCFEIHRVFQNKIKQETFCNSHPNLLLILVPNLSSTKTICLHQTTSVIFFSLNF